MKGKLIIAALVVATIAALVFSLGAFAKVNSTTTNSTNSSACTPIDPEGPAATTNGAVPNTGSSSSSSSNSTSGAAATSAATSTPMATATTSGTGSSTTTTGTATAMPAATATTSTSGGAASTPTATTSTSGGAASTPTATTSGTGSTGTTGAVAEPHETTFCSHGMKVDIAVPHGGTASLSSGNNGSNGIPVTGNSSSNGNNGSALNQFTVTSANSVTINLNDANGGKVNAAHMEVCFNNTTTSGRIFQWWDANMFATWFKNTNTAARWVPLPTTNTGSMACAQSWLPGTYMLVP